MNYAWLSQWASSGPLSHMRQGNIYRLPFFNVPFFNNSRSLQISLLAFHLLPLFPAQFVSGNGALSGPPPIILSLLALPEAPLLGRLAFPGVPAHPRFIPHLFTQAACPVTGCTPKMLFHFRNQQVT